MASNPTCPFMIGEPPGYWHFHRCSRPGKFIIDVHGIEKHVCGIHKRMHDRRPLQKGDFDRKD